MVVKTCTGHVILNSIFLQNKSTFKKKKYPKFGEFVAETFQIMSTLDMSTQFTLNVAGMVWEIINIVRLTAYK